MTAEKKYRFTGLVKQISVEFVCVKDLQRFNLANKLGVFYEEVAGGQET